MPERRTHPRPRQHTYLHAASQRILGVGVPSPRVLARRPDTHNATTSDVLTPSRRKNYVPASPGDCRQMEHTCMPIAPSGTLLLTGIGCGTLPLAPRPPTATATACDSNLDSGHHDMSRLSTSAYLNDAPIYALPTYRWTGQQSGSCFPDVAPSIPHYNWF
jgi:hypothetical protein